MAVTPDRTDDGNRLARFGARQALPVRRTGRIERGHEREAAHIPDRARDGSLSLTFFKNS